MRRLMSVPLRIEANGVEVWLECKGTRHQWSGPEAKAGTRLRDRCLDGCYGNRRQSEALCISHTGRSQWRRRRGKQGDEGLGEMKRGGWERLNKQLARSKLQTGCQHGSAARRQIVAGERGYAGPRLRLRSHTLTSVNQR